MCLTNMRAKTLFTREPGQIRKLLLCMTLSILLMIGDYRKHYLPQVRHDLARFIFSLYWVLDAPSKVKERVKNYFSLHSRLVEENQYLRHQQFLLEGQLQTLRGLESENDRLRGLLHTAKRTKDNLLLAQVLQVDPDPFVHQLVLNKGSQQGVYVGQPIIDEGGILGEIIEVSPETSKALLITDASYALPVEILRNGTRAVIAGTSTLNRLQLQYIADTRTVQVGDKLITSGLGGRYPSGYPVGEVHEIVHETDDVFAKIWVTPSAHLTRSREIMLLFPGGMKPKVSSETSTETAEEGQE